MTPDSPYCQRWRDRQHSWRHTSEGGFDKTRYEVALTDQDAVIRAFVEQHHYSRAYCAAVIRAALYHRGEMVGVAVFGSPMQVKVLTNAFPGLTPYSESLELCRFVLLDEVPANAESWFLGQAFRLGAHQGLRGVVSHADPVPRRLPDGTILSPGHVGTIYQASNGLHTAGRSTARTLLLGPDGSVVSARSLQKVRRQERGHSYVERQLLGWGARPLSPGEDPAAWLRAVVPQIVGASKLRHPGNYRYLFRLGRTTAERSRVVIGLTTGAPYPKKEAA